MIGAGWDWGTIATVAYVIVLAPLAIAALGLAYYMLAVTLAELFGWD